MGLRSADSHFNDLGEDQWNQIIYTKIAVLGDSLSAQWPLFPKAWPMMLEDRLNSAGARVEVRNFSTGGHSFFRANSTATYGTDTAVNKVIGYKPDVVIVELGGNDAIYTATSTGDSRSLAQIQADASSTFSTLAASLPAALLIQLKFTFYDTANFTTSNVKNKGIIPRWMTKKSAGILDGLDTSEYLDDAVSSTNRTILDDYDSLQATIAAISGVQVITVDLFKIERLGVTLVDRIHLTETGHALLGGDVLKQLRANAAFSAIVPVIATQPTGNLFEGEDVEALFDDYLAASGDGYADNTPGTLNGEDTNSSWGINSRSIHTDNWFMDYKASCVVEVTTAFNSVGPEGFFSAYITNAAPLALVSYSIDGASFISSGISTDQRGCAVIKLPAGLLNLSNAAHSFRFKCGNAVFGPISITLATNIFFITNTTNVGNVGAGEDNLMVNNLTAGFFLPAAGRRVRVFQHGTMANNAASKLVKSYFGSTVVVQFNTVTSLAGNWQIEYIVTSTGTDAQKYQGRVIAQSAATTWVPLAFQGTLTEDDGATIPVKCTGTATNDNDIIQTYQEIEPK